MDCESPCIISIEIIEIDVLRSSGEYCRCDQRCTKKWHSIISCICKYTVQQDGTSVVQCILASIQSDPPGKARTLATTYYYGNKVYIRKWHKSHTYVEYSMYYMTHGWTDVCHNHFAKRPVYGSPTHQLQNYKRYVYSSMKNIENTYSSCLISSEPIHP